MPSHEVNDFIAGAIGGAASIASSYPMDTIKVRLQAKFHCKTKKLKIEFLEPDKDNRQV